MQSWTEQYIEYHCKTVCYNGLPMRVQRDVVSVELNIIGYLYVLIDDK